jgi:hypothetical protein
MKNVQSHCLSNANPDLVNYYIRIHITVTSWQHGCHLGPCLVWQTDNMMYLFENLLKYSTINNKLNKLMIGFKLFCMQTVVSAVGLNLGNISAVIFNTTKHFVCTS